MLGIYPALTWILLLCHIFFGLAIELSFSTSPYIRLLTFTIYMFALTFWWFARTKKFSGKLPMTSGVVWLLALAIVWLAVGIGTNPLTPYIATDFYFFVASLACFLIGRDLAIGALRHSYFRHDISKLNISIYWAIVAFIGASVLIKSINMPAIFPLLILCSMATDLYLKRARLIPSIVTVSFVGIYAYQGNRAFLLAAIISMAMIYSLSTGRTSRTRILRIFAAISAIAIFAFSLISVLPLLPADSAIVARLRETQVTFELFASGNDSSTFPIAIRQRFYEAEVVSHHVLWHPDSPIITLFGHGFGALLDMTRSDDDSVTGNAVLGASAVHNIHFLPYMILYRFGLVGATFAIYLLYGLTRKIAYLILESRSQTAGLSMQLKSVKALQMAALCCTVGWLVYSSFASAAIFDNPFFLLSVGIVSTIAHPLLKRRSLIQDYADMSSGFIASTRGVDAR